MAAVAPLACIAPPPYRGVVTDQTSLRGLCATCRHARTIQNARGSQFVLCELSRTDPRFARYPRLPVTACAGFEPGRQSDLDAPDEGPLDSADITKNGL